MQYIEAVDLVEPKYPSIFLAGGITGCPDWQRIIKRQLISLENITIINPRRIDFPMGDPAAGVRQIEWEHDALSKADSIVFWFPKETLCPITLFELGSWAKSPKPLIVGVHEEYMRRLDVEVQMRLARPGLPVLVGFAAFCDRVYSAASYISRTAGDTHLGL